MKRAALFLHAVRPEAATVGRWLAEALADRGIEVEALPPDAARLGEAVGAAGDRFPEGTDLLFVLGGDGTLLRAAELACHASVPVLGVNVGHLGFLANVERSEIERALDDILAGALVVDERMVIEGEVRGGGEEQRIWAMNDAIVQKSSIGRAVRLSINIGGERFVTLSADGVIVATPTGSTAYSFSAGGPVVSPELECLIVTTVAPHALFTRSLVVAPGEPIEIEVVSGPEPALLSPDGRAPIEVQPGARIRLRVGESRVKLARTTARPFWSLVREKFGLR